MELVASEVVVPITSEQGLSVVLDCIRQALLLSEQTANASIGIADLCNGGDECSLQRALKYLEEIQVMSRLRPTPTN
jgi:hypothetical protein